VDVVEWPDVQIPPSDGTVLAARIWLPADASTAPVSAILEYMPYRKRDGTTVRDELTYPWFAEHGYAGVRVDIRGNGESQGLMTDEYLAQEQADALEVIDWIAAQPWCTGSLGMMGLSWGGFNALQVAALRPEPAPPRQHAAAGEDVEVTPGQGRLLEARLGLRGLQRHHRRHVRRGRMGGTPTRTPCLV